MMSSAKRASSSPLSGGTPRNARWDCCPGFASTSATFMPVCARACATARAPDDLPSPPEPPSENVIRAVMPSAYAPGGVETPLADPAFLGRRPPGM